MAFELARELRRRNQPLPSTLIVSGAKAPQFRLGHVPPPAPADEALIEEFVSLQNSLKDMLASPELRSLFLPAMRADAALYRNYVYFPEAPLECPIVAYGGMGDGRVRPEQLEAWRAQTASSFKTRIFPGGHFFLREHEMEFLAALKADIPS